MKSRRKKIIVPMIGIGAILLIWYGVCRAELFSAYVLPPPYRVFRSFYKMAVNGELEGYLHQLSQGHKGILHCFCAGLWPGDDTVSAAGDREIL